MDSVRWCRSPVHFFKIILSDISTHSRLMIPRKFISERGYDLGDTVSLRAPAGSVWEVELERSRDEVWLGRGWPDFAANYSICFGHFLVFRYEGNSYFHVIILDHSATEVEYPLTNFRSEPTYINKGYRKRKEVATTSDNIGSTEEFRNCPMLSRKKKYVSACAEASHQVRDQDTKAQENVSKTSNKMRIEDTDDEYDNTCDLKASTKSKKIHLDGSMKEDRGKGGKNLMLVTSEAEKARVLASAKAFRSKNPFFVVVIQPSYVSGQFIPTVPKSFVTKYITQDHSNVILQVSDGRDWPVKCTVYCSNAKFTGGWRIFAKENSLRVDDVCVFELINFSGNLLKVFIFRAAKGTYINQGHQKRKESAMAKNNIGGMEEFANCHRAKDRLSMPLHMPSKKTKTVSDCVEASHLVRLWKPKTQETAMVTLIKKMKSEAIDDESENTHKLKVSIKSEEEHLSNGTQKDIGNGDNGLLCVTSEAERARAFALANAYKSEKPFFIVKMQPSYITAKLNLTVPKKFVTKFITHDRDNVLLRVPDGRTWPVKCAVNYSNGKLGIGWTIFAEQNNLAVGDVCVFELISSSRKLLNVIIFRAARGPGL